jgi:hypothetical protein
MESQQSTRISRRNTELAASVAKSKALTVVDWDPVERCVQKKPITKKDTTRNTCKVLTKGDHLSLLVFPFCFVFHQVEVENFHHHFVFLISESCPSVSLSADNDLTNLSAANSEHQSGGESYF